MGRSRHQALPSTETWQRFDVMESLLCIVCFFVLQAAKCSPPPHKRQMIVTGHAVGWAFSEPVQTTASLRKSPAQVWLVSSQQH